MIGGDTTAGYDFVVASPWLPVRPRPLRWRDGIGSTDRILRSSVAAHGGAWVGCATTGPAEATLLDDVWLHPITLDSQAVDDYVHGHCAATLAPLYHDNGPAPRFHPRWQAAYRAVNRRAADTVAGIAAPGATVWVHDYHLQLLPGFLRVLRPDTRIGFFLHSPFPAVERFTMQPLREEILTSLLHADVLGFQHGIAAANLVRAVGALHGDHLPRISRGNLIGVFPTSVDIAGIETLTRLPQVRHDVAKIRDDLGNPRTVLLSLGAPEHGDAALRLLDAYADLLAERRIDPADTVLVHATVCGVDDTHHDCDRDRLDRIIAQINGVHGRLGRPAVHYIHREHSRSDIVTLYLAADVMLALPLRDGMNLAAKEYLAARTANTGRLVLSEFSGAAIDLPHSNPVNPHDIDAVKTAIMAAIGGCHTASAGIAEMRGHLHRHDSAGWARDFLTTLSRTSGHHPADTIKPVRR